MDRVSERCRRGATQRTLDRILDCVEQLDGYRIETRVVRRCRRSCRTGQRGVPRRASAARRPMASLGCRPTSLRGGDNGGLNPTGIGVTYRRILPDRQWMLRTPQDRGGSPPRRTIAKTAAHPRAQRLRCKHPEIVGVLPDSNQSCRPELAHRGGGRLFRQMPSGWAKLSSGSMERGCATKAWAQSQGPPVAAFWENFGNARDAKPEATDIIGVPKGIRTPVAAVKGRCPRPLDDGDGSGRAARV
jgi:hypothetical protein